MPDAEPDLATALATFPPTLERRYRGWELVDAEYHYKREMRILAELGYVPDHAMWKPNRWVDEGWNDLRWLAGLGADLAIAGAANEPGNEWLRDPIRPENNGTLTVTYRRVPGPDPCRST